MVSFTRRHLFQGTEGASFPTKGTASCRRAGASEGHPGLPCNGTAARGLWRPMAAEEGKWIDRQYGLILMVERVDFDG